MTGPDRSSCRSIVGAEVGEVQRVRVARAGVGRESDARTRSRDDPSPAVEMLVPPAIAPCAETKRPVRALSAVSIRPPAIVPFETKQPFRVDRARSPPRRPR